MLCDPTRRIGPVTRSPATLLLLASLAAPAAADTVHLVDGNKFEEVAAVRDGEVVRIRMPYGEIVLPGKGEIVLPGKVVSRIERSQSVWQEYGRLEGALLDAAS